MAKTKGAASKARQSLVQLRDETPQLFETLLERGALLKAYLDSSPRTCGSPHCRCARGEKHPAWVVRIPQEKGTRSRSVSKETFERLTPLSEEYRRFRQAATRWRKLVAEVDEALGILERERLVDPERALERET